VEVYIRFIYDNTGAFVIWTGYYSQPGQEIRSTVTDTDEGTALYNIATFFYMYN